MTQDTALSTRKFSEYALAPDVLEALERMGFETMTPIQEKVIPPILEGRDVVGKAETGTGKTVGFGAPLAGRIDTQRVAVQGLVLAPTRELAQQVAGVLEELGTGRNLKVALIVGGVHASEQIEKLRSGCQVVVGTPGRVLDFLKERILSLGWCEVVVLDEADRMLDMGFIEDVSEILRRTPKERQTLLFSATIPDELKRLLDRFMKNPVILSTSEGLSTVPDIRQYYVECEFPAKFRRLRKILDSHPDETAIVFCNTRRQAIDLDRMLWGHGYSAGALHGDQDQEARFRILDAFRKGEIKVLVATDVASRGLDIEDVARVINYEIPEESEAYVHRIGRTGRAKKTGEAISLVSRKEKRRWRQILAATGFQVERLDSRGGPSGSGGTRGGTQKRSSGSRNRGRAGARKASRKEESSSAGIESAGGGPTGEPGAGESEAGAAQGAGGTESAGAERGRGRRSKRGRRKRGGETASQESAKSAAGTQTPKRVKVKVPPPPKPEKKYTLKDLEDDDFVKLDYFDVGESQTPKEKPEEKPQGGSQQAERSGGGEAKAAQKGGGSRPRRRGGKRRRRKPKN